MTFSFWSLDFIYYPVSGIMWVWHKVFGFVFGLLGATNPYSNAWTWVLSVMFLVFTLRMIMFKPFMKQMDASLKMQKIQPEMKRIREKYKDDRQRLTEEMMKLNKEAGVNPLASCLPALLQAPAFIGLFHVLRNFITAYTGGPPAIKVSGAPVNNYFFPVSDVQSFHDALLFGGASLSAHLTMPVTSADPLVTSLTDLQSTRETMLWVGIPLMILAAVATHLSSRKSIARQKDMGTAQTGGQMAIMQKLMLWGFPLGVLFIGAFYPLALLFYWLANNFWTFGQLALAHRIQDRKLEAAAVVVEEAKEAGSFSKPRPGAKPQRGPKAVDQTAGPERGVANVVPTDASRNGKGDKTSGSDGGGRRDAAAGSGAGSEGSAARGGAAGGDGRPGAGPGTGASGRANGGSRAAGAGGSGAGGSGAGGSGSAGSGAAGGGSENEPGSSSGGRKRKGKR